MNQYKNLFEKIYTTKNEKIYQDLKEWFNDSYIIYLDMDGVLTDFVKHFNNTFDDFKLKKDDYISGDILFPKIDKYPNWWLSMPWTKNGKYLLSQCRKLCSNIKLLTTPAISVKTCKEDKLNWAKKEIGDIEVIFSHKKEEYANKYSILIDDDEDNIKKFELFGGIGIYYNNNIKEVIDKLKGIFK